MEMMSERYRREHDTEKFARRVCVRWAEGGVRVASGPGGGAGSMVKLK